MDRELVLKLAREAELREAEAHDYRGGYEQMPLIEQQALDQILRFAALVEQDVLDRVAETVDNLAKCYHDPVNSALKALAETIRGQHE